MNRNIVGDILRRWWKISIDKDKEAETVRSISEGAIFRSSDLWVLMFAILIASLGLNVNSTAVIIGAMLISPLMGPILGMGLALGINDFDLMRRALKNFLVATLVSVLTAMVYFLLSPLTEAKSELLARTSPTLYDVLIALCGGAAGIIATATYDKGNNVIPGVAIATALMPPLCTAGYGLAMGGAQFFFGAFYLFFINTVFICLATYIGVRLMGFSPVRQASSRIATLRKRVGIGIVVATLIPAAYLTYGIVRQSIHSVSAGRFIKEELVFDGTQIISNDMDAESKTLTVVAVGREISQASIDSVQGRLGGYGLSKYRLAVIQGSSSDSILRLNNLLSVSTEENHRQLLEQSQHIHALEEHLAAYTRYEEVSPDIINELRTLDPDIRSLSLSPVVEVGADTAVSYTLAVVGVKSVRKFDEQKVRNWLQVRLKADSLRVVATNY